MIAVYRSKIEKAITRAVSAPTGYGWEDGIQKLYADHGVAEMNLIGGIMADPLNGLDMAVRAGVDHSIIVDDGLWIIYASATICRTNGRLTGQRFDDGMTVAKTAKIGLRAQGLWDDADDRSFVSGSFFGPGPLAAMLHSWPSAAMVPHFANQLTEINHRIDTAREHLRQARQLVDGRDEA